MTRATRFLGRTEKLLVVIGPSGAGKTTLVERLVKAGILELTPSWTTRQERQGREAASDHVFTDEAGFERLKAAGFFLETVQLFGLPHHYGLPKVTHNDPRAIPVVVLRTAVLPLLRRHYENVTVYQVEASEVLAVQRLRARGGPAEEQQKRLAHNRAELPAGRQVAARTFVNDGTVEELCAAVLSALRADFAESSAAKDAKL